MATPILASVRDNASLQGQVLLSVYSNKQAAAGHFEVEEGRALDSFVEARSAPSRKNERDGLTE